MDFYTGCSGYYYNHWREIFYPVRLPKNKWLPFYAERIKTVEVNSSFYNLLSERALKNWYEITPPDFIFTLKGYRFITHVKKLLVDADTRIVMNEFLQKALLLKEKIGCILWQLPPQLSFNPQRLQDFCKLLTNDFDHVIEFRHLSWYQKETIDLLTDNNIGFCMVSAPGLPELVTGIPKVAYLRFHGKNDWYNYNYSHQELKLWAERLKLLNSNKVFSYFNNDFYGYAINNCIEFEHMLQLEKIKV